MTTPTSDQNIIAIRRARVAQLKLRGLTTREIALALAQGDAEGYGRVVNPKTHEPYDHATIVRDLEVLRGEWREERLQDTDTHIDRQIAEINEIKRAAWATSDPELALKALDREMKILGTMKPLKFEFTFDISLVLQVVELIEQRGDDVDQWFRELIQDFYEADSEEVQEAEDIINGAHGHANS